MPGPQKLPEYQHHWIPAADQEIHVVELPAGRPPMVLLHGIGMDWRVWQAISRRLHPYFRLYMLDLRGHGDSGKPAHGYTLPEYAADVEDVLDALRLEDVTLVGSSLGGMVAATVEAPAGLVSHRVLVDPPLTGGPIRDARMLREILLLKHEPEEALATYLGRSNPGAGQLLVQAMSQMWHRAADGVITDMLDRPEDFNAIDSALRAIDAPVLLLQADPALGAVLTDEEVARSLTLLPEGTWRQVTGAGHAIHAFKPIEFTELVLEFSQQADWTATIGAQRGDQE